MSNPTQEQLAHAIVAAIRPKPSQHERKLTLQKLLGNHDTFMGGGGETNPSFGAGLGAISKAMRPFFANSNRVHELAIPKPRRDRDSGRYLGQTYRITPLGQRVKDILLAEGSI